MVGGTDKQEEGVWRWGDGTVFSRGSTIQAGGAPSEMVWSSGEPNDAGGNEDCLHLIANMKVNDVQCTHAGFKYICEHKGKVMIYILCILS